MDPNRKLQDTATKMALTYAPVLESMGLKQGTVGYNRTMFNVIDMANLDEGLVPHFIEKIPEAIKAGTSIEALAKARADSFQNPKTGQWIYNPEMFANYNELYAEQRSRAAGYDYMGAVS
jgi:hypothetical protein